MPQFHHVVLTRFNIKLPLKNNIFPDETWLKHRFSLFEKFCFSSMRGQRNQNFSWLVFLDKDTPLFITEKIEELGQWNNFMPCYVGAMKDLDVPALIRHRLSLKYDFIITTNLDNDDAVSDDFVENIQNNFKGTPSFLLFKNGYILKLDELKREMPARLYRCFDSFPFSSLIETTEGFHTVWHVENHFDKFYKQQMVRLDLEPQWVQVCHSNNLANAILPFHRRLSLRELKGRFNVDYGMGDEFENRFFIFMENRVRAFMAIYHKWRIYLFSRRERNKRNMAKEII